jgi:hypothetical protein
LATAKHCIGSTNPAASVGDFFAIGLLLLDNIEESPAEAHSGLGSARANPSLPLDLINSTSMCGRYTLRRDYERVRHELRVETGGGSIIFEPPYNVAPTDPVPILRLLV